MGEPGSSSADAAASTLVVENPVVAMVMAAEAAAASAEGQDVEAQQRPPSRQASSTQAKLARPSRSGASLSLSLEGRAVSATRAGSHTSAAPAPCDGTDQDLGGSVNSGSSSLHQPLLPGWQRTGDEPSLAEANSSVKFPDASAPWYKKLFAFSGLGFLVAVGYMDPGNWATGLAGGSKFGYTLLCIVLMSNLMAMFLQHLALKLGIAAERDLAQACRDAYNKWVNYFLWFLAEIAIAATDLAEVIGTAIALNLLFGLPLWAGVIITAADALLLLLFEQRAFRVLELVVTLMTLAILVCFIYELVVVKPNWLKVLRGYVPSGSVVTNPEQLYIAIGILGATVMPHNLYLHSSVIQTRAYPRTNAGKRMAIKYGTIDSTLSLLMAFFINSSIVILAGAAFYYGNPPRRDVEDISEAYHILAPALGTHAASILFGVALLCSGQQSTITGTLAGQIVMEGFLNIKLKPFFRRLITRGIAIVPAATVAACMGAQGVNRLLVLSQVILSLQLSFAVVPLVHFTSSKAHMGEKFVNRWYVIVVAVIMTLVIAGLNVYLVVSAGKDGTLSQ